MLLQLRHVGKNFEGSKKETIKDISLDIKDGEFVCIVGPSGCGKSTLLNLVAGLDHPTQGEILLNGKRIEGPGADRVVMFQEAALYPWLNVLDNVKFGVDLIGLPEAEQERRAAHFLKMVGLSEFKDYPIHKLSGGMKQRTALARALAMDSEILLMDEPFSALDKQTINVLRRELVEIWLETKKTIIYVTHSVEEAVFFADRVVVLSDNPGEVKHIYDIELERPREIDSGSFLKYRKKILDEVQREVSKIAEQEFKA